MDELTREAILDRVPGLEDGDAPAPVGERSCRDEAGKASSDDDDVEAFHGAECTMENARYARNC
jgi:hypothetical protein